MTPTQDSLPTLTGAPPLEGRIRVELEDFRVDEVPAYAPEGAGEHLFVHFEKTNLDTPAAIRRIAEALGVDSRDAGYAGLKDRRAVTRQWASFLSADETRLPEANIEGVRILETARHRHKLRTGHLAANRFDLKVRCTELGGLDEVRSRLAELARRGLPNYFGDQRFGRDGENLDGARRWIMEKGPAPRDRFRRKLYVSTLQAALFNELLAERVREGSLDGVIPGDLLRKDETGGLFLCEQPEIDGPRAERFEVSPTGPMFGAAMRWPEGEARVREEAALERWALTKDDLERFRKSGEGTRRPYRVRLTEAQIEPEAEGFRLRFTLPSGAYATVLLRELVRLSP